jgi:class 3 adenylate cyclase
MEDDVMIPPVFGEYIARSIPGARLVLLPGKDHLFLRTQATPVIDEVERFVTGDLSPFSDRVRTTVLFTDIVDSTPLAASLGDEDWSVLIDEHNDRVRSEVIAHGGHVVKGTGDGYLIAFDDPAAAIRCARAAMEVVRDLSLELRAGVHVGEVARMGNHDLSGLTVHFAQRLCARAAGGQVLASREVVDACSGVPPEPEAAIEFADQGMAELKGIPGEWEVFEARPG